MKIGYTRVSKREQHEGLQEDALKEAGCEKFFMDKISGAKFEREGLNAALAFARSGDTLVVWKLDRLGRSLKNLIETVNTLKERGVEFVSLTEKIDTTTPGGKLIFHLMGALAEFERDLTRERTSAGLEAARARGRKGGRPKALKTAAKVALAQVMAADKSRPIKDICEVLGISRTTLYRYTRPEQVDVDLLKAATSGDPIKGERKYENAVIYFDSTRQHSKESEES